MTAVSVVQRTVQIEQDPRTGRCSLVEAQIDRAIGAMAGSSSGFAHLFLLDPSEGASLSFNENSDPAVRRDIAAAAERTSGASFARAQTYGSRSLLLPVERGRLSHGTWQGLYLCDWTDDRDVRRPRPFTLAVTLLLGPACAVVKSTFVPPSRGFHSMLSTAARLLGSTAGGSDTPDGLGCVMVRHCSASMAYVEDERVRPVLERALSIVVPDKWSGKFFEHTYEGWDDCPGHCKNALVGGPCVLVPMTAGGRLVLGAGEDIALGEHRDDWGSSGRSISVTRFPGCFVAADTVSVQLRSSPAMGVEIAASVLQPKVAAGLAILKGPSATCFVVAPAGKSEEYMHEALVTQRRTSDDFLRGKWRGPCGESPSTFEIVRSIIFGGGRTRILAVKDGALWLPEGCSLYLLSMAAQGFQQGVQQVSFEASWFGPK